MAKLKSMDVTIRGVTRTFEFDPATPVDSDDEGEASLELLGEAETTEVQLGGGISSAEVTVRGTITYEVEFSYEVEDLEGEDIEDESGIIDYVENEDLEDEASEAVANGNYTTYDFRINEVTVEQALDEDGDAVDL